MLQNKYEMPLDLIINESKILNFYFYLIVFFSFISIFISSLSLSIKILFCIILLVSIIFSFKRKSLSKVTSLRLDNDSKWKIEVNNELLDAELYGECIVTYFVVWLNFTVCNSFGKKKQFQVLLLPDSTNKNSLRMLRVRLRFLKNENANSTAVHKEIIN